MNERNKVKRGRTGVDQIPAMQEKSQAVEPTREDAAHSAGRPPRISMSVMKKLEVPQGLLEDGYYYRWFKDSDGRLGQAQAAYYEFVTDEQGNRFSRVSGPNTMFLMRLPQQYRDEDNALKRARVAATLEEEASLGANEYSPSGKDSAVTHTDH